MGRTAEALACYDKAIEANPRDSKAHAGKAAALDRLGRHEEADSVWNGAVDSDPFAAAELIDRMVRDSERS